MTTMYKELVEYFCLDVKKTTMEEFFGDIKTFLDFFEVRIDTFVLISCALFWSLPKSSCWLDFSEETFPTSEKKVRILN